MTRLAILFSGRGSNMLALIHAAATNAIPAQIALALTNRPDSPGLLLAQAQGIEALAIDHRRFGKDRPAHEAELDAALRARDVELVCLAGYMRLFTPAFVAAWAGRMLNIHPSLLPSFPGLHPHRQALEAGVRLHGCTVHLVTDATDSGPILAQAAIPVLPNDDEDTLAARVLVQEHRLYPMAIRTFLTRTPEPPPTPALANAFRPAA